MRRGEVWWADLGSYRLREQTGRRPVVIWQSGTLTRVLQAESYWTWKKSPETARLPPQLAAAGFVLGWRLTNERPDC